MDNSILSVVILSIFVLILLYKNTRLREDKEKAICSMHKVINPIFYDTVAPYELAIYYAKLYKETERKATEFQNAFLSLNCEWAEENDEMKIEVKYMSASDVIDAYIKKEILTKDWRITSNRIPYVPMSKIKEDEQRFKDSFSAAFKKL